MVLKKSANILQIKYLLFTADMDSTDYLVLSMLLQTLQQCYTESSPKQQSLDLNLLVPMLVSYNTKMYFKTVELVKDVINNKKILKEFPLL